MYEYDCRDCGMHVCSMTGLEASPYPYCCGCAFLHGIENPNEREAARTFMTRIGTIGDGRTENGCHA